MAGGPAAPVNGGSIGWFLRYSMGLSAWKAYRETRWALRVNPSSGNLHPTEAYLIHDGRVCHYAPREHALEERAVLPNDDWCAFLDGHDGFLVALTSIQWREAWKYGERAFRYCQHDVGHAIAALRVSASFFGWNLRLLPEWPDEQLAALLGVDRDEDRAGAEREHPECMALVAPSVSWNTGEPARLVSAARRANWSGRANLLSRGHDDWSIIDEVTEATKYSGIVHVQRKLSTSEGSDVRPDAGWGVSPALVLRRRSAVAFDARSPLTRERFLAMLAMLDSASPPFDALDWPPHVHLAVFVHRVEGVVPGVYVCLRDAGVRAEWQAALRPEFLWEPVAGSQPRDATGADGERLFLLLPADVTSAANRISCDQEIAGDGFFSLGMIARVESALRERGEWFYRRLFWECGMIGQVLYLAAEAAGARGTGIGCFYDDAVHGVLGLEGLAWQSLYHFAMGMPVDDPRLTTEPGYSWEPGAR